MKKELLLGIVGLIFGFVYFAMTGIAFLGHQIIDYFKFGNWVSQSVIDLIIRTKRYGLTEWADKPDKWLGVHEILSSLNGGATFIVIGLIIWFAFYTPLLKRIIEKEKEEEKLN